MYNAGLILEGGGMRGVYTARCIRCLFRCRNRNLPVYMEILRKLPCNAATFLNREEGHSEECEDYLDDLNYCDGEILLKTGNVFNRDAL